MERELSVKIRVCFMERIPRRSETELVRQLWVQTKLCRSLMSWENLQSIAWDLSYAGPVRNICPPPRQVNNLTPRETDFFF